MSSISSNSFFMWTYTRSPSLARVNIASVSGEKAFQWKVALVLFGVLFLGVSDTQLVAPLLPLIARDFGISPGSAGMIVTTYSLAAAAFALIVGPVSDRVGRKKVLAVGLLLFS